VLLLSKHRRKRYIESTASHGSERKDTWTEEVVRAFEVAKAWEGKRNNLAR
jgi:hypothetical protein